MQDASHIIFVEVRYRKNDNFGSALQSVNTKKQMKIINSAQNFLIENIQFKHHSIRFDVIGITGNDLQWIQNAF